MDALGGLMAKAIDQAGIQLDQTQVKDRLFALPELRRIVSVPSGGTYGAGEPTRSDDLPAGG
ncbi:hypothetical protein ACLB1Q_21630 [Escherichia coli]